MVSIIRQQLMNYIDIYSFLEDPEGAWLRIIKQREKRYEMSLFPELKGAFFRKKIIQLFPPVSLTIQRIILTEISTSLKLAPVALGLQKKIMLNESDF